MKIAMLTDLREEFDSLRHVYTCTESILSRSHEVIRLPSGYSEASDRQKFRMNADLIEQCDVVVATARVEFLRVRERVGKRIPYLLFMFGGAPRGMPNLRRPWRYLTTGDVLIGNCPGDIAIARAFFPNANTAILPWPVDGSRFYPLQPRERERLKAAWGFSKRDSLLLYAGRITLEKNVHTLLLIFSVLQKLDSNMHLVIAGEVSDFEFPDFGVYPSRFGRWLNAMAIRTGVERKRLHFVGHKTPSKLQQLYGVADVFVNMTLHHDENFGLAQVEAMACGTPVVGTNWGGLQETILDGVTGSKVPTRVTDSGVKSNWLVAAGEILQLLRRTQRNGSMRRKCRARAEERYSLAKYRGALERVLVRAVGERRPGEPLELSDFGRQVWRICSRGRDDSAPYRRGPKSFRVYQRLIRPYASGGPEALGSLKRFAGSLYIPWPVRWSRGRDLEIHDPMFPMILSVPPAYLEIVRDVLELLAARPVLPARQVAGELLTRHNGDAVETAVRWMLRSGVLLSVRGKKQTAGVCATFSGFAGRRFFSIPQSWNRG